MLTRRMLMACAVLLAVSGSAFAQPASPTITLDAAANGGSTTIAAGTMFAIALPENPSTGYTWKQQPSPIPVVGIVGDRFVPETNEPKAGAPGTRIMTFAALKPGTETIMLTLGRAWEDTAPPTETYKVTITVSAGHDNP